MNGSAGFSLRSDLVHSVYRIGVCQISDQFRRHCLLNCCDSVTIIASSPEKYLAGIVGPVPPQSYYDCMRNARNFRAIRAIPGIRVLIFLNSKCQFIPTAYSDPGRKTLKQWLIFVSFMSRLLRRMSHLCLVYVPFGRGADDRM